MICFDIRANPSSAKDVSKRLLPTESPGSC